MFMIKLGNIKGSQFVEASVALPIIILTVLLLVRIFAFYLEILVTGIKEHEIVYDKWKTYEGKGVTKYSREVESKMMRGGILGFDLVRTLEVSTHFCNEDLLARSRYLINDKE